METNRLRQFMVFADTGNLRKAASLLGISHSGLFKSLKILERELGYSLFVPKGRNIVISDQGRDLYARSGAFLADLDRFMGRSDPAPATRLRLGSFEVFTSYFVGKLLSDDLPESEVEVHELVPGKLEEALLLGKIDVGITYEPIPRKGIEYEKIVQIRMGAYARRGAFPNQETLSIPFAVPVNPIEGTPSGVKGLDAWPDHRFKRDTRFKVDLMLTGLELTRQGLCAIFIPQFVAQLHNQTVSDKHQLVSRALPRGMPPVHRDVYLVRRESTAENSTLRQIAKALRRICSSAVVAD